MRKDDDIYEMLPEALKLREGEIAVARETAVLIATRNSFKAEVLRYAVKETKIKLRVYDLDHFYKHEDLVLPWFVRLAALQEN